MKKAFYLLFLFPFLLYITSCGSSGSNSDANQKSSPISPATLSADAHPSKIAENMVLIPSGEFVMGSENDDAAFDEKPPHTIYLDAFYIDKYEVTNRQYQNFIKETKHPPPFVDAEWAAPYNWIGTSFPDGMADHPVVLINWNDAQAYAEWAGKRLPTEAEWEKASRGGLISKRYPHGDELKLNHANFYKGFLREKRIKQVGSFKPNGYGLYDMTGNVWEWCQDWYDEKYYSDSLTQNPQGPGGGFYRVVRGGAWVNEINFLRCSQRGKNVPEAKSHIVGFRCALSAK